MPVEFNDAINPKHYKTILEDGRELEAIEVIKALASPEELKGYLKFSLFKYFFRCGRKDEELKELKKCKWFLDTLIEWMEEKCHK